MDEQIFRMYGNKIQLYHYKVIYYEDETPYEEYFVFLNEAEQSRDTNNGVLIEIDTTQNNWLEGLEVPNSSNPMIEAIELYKLGENGYKQKLLFEENKRNEQLRADIDYIMLMGGLI